MWTVKGLHQTHKNWSLIITSLESWNCLLLLHSPFLPPDFIPMGSDLQLPLMSPDLPISSSGPPLGDTTQGQEYNRVGDYSRLEVLQMYPGFFLLQRRRLHEQEVPKRSYRGKTYYIFILCAGFVYGFCVRLLYAAFVYGFCVRVLCTGFVYGFWFTFCHDFVFCVFFGGGGGGGVQQQKRSCRREKCKMSFVFFVVGPPPPIFGLIMQPMTATLCQDIDKTNKSDIGEQIKKTDERLFLDLNIFSLLF